MKKFNKFLKSFLFVLIWFSISSYLEKYWRIIHWEFIFLYGREIFDHIFWLTLKKFIFEFDIGFYIEESFKYIPIYIVLRKIWIKK